MAEKFGNEDDSDVPVGAEAVNRLIRENSSIFSDGHCKVCSAVLISESQKLAHYQSKKHATKYRRYLMIHQGEEFTPAKRRRPDVAVSATDDNDRNKCCPVCNMTFSSPVVAASHYEGKIHAKNLRMTIQPDLKDAIPVPKKTKVIAPPAVPGKTSDPEKFCSLCSATFNNPHMAQQHYAGKKHKKQETKSKIMTIYSSSGTAMPQTTPLKPLTPGTSSTGNGFTCVTCNIVVNSLEQYQAHISGAKHKNNLRSGFPSSLDGASPLQSVGPKTNRPPPSRFSFSARSFSASGFYSSPLSDVLPPLPPPPPVPAPLPHGPPSERSGFSHGLLPLPSYTSQNYEPYPPKHMSGSDGYNYFNQGF